MKAIELFHESGKPAGVYYCNECRIVHKEMSSAEECCKPRLCSKCGKETDQRYITVCEECRDRSYRERWAGKLESAELVEQYDGWLYWEGHGCREGYFEDMGELLDYLADVDKEGWPEFVHTCQEVTMSQRSADDIIEDSTQDMHEEACELVDSDSKAKLELALAEFYAANMERVVSYEPDYSRKVRVEE